MILTGQILALLLQTVAQPPCAVFGRVTDSSGAPIRNARIELLQSGGLTSVSDGQGRYCVPTISGLTEVRLLVNADGYQEELSPPTPIDRPPIQIDITLTKQFSETVTVRGRAENLVGVSASASEGIIGADELSVRPLLRPTDLMEAIPGVAMTQHSTGGHAPIVLLRGYNLDHGTDFATFVDGVPLNLPSHAHAHGYTDTNFLIPDLVGRVEFKKGPYTAAIGDFGTAGAANIELVDSLPQDVVSLECGQFGYVHGTAAASRTRGTNRWVFGVEGSHSDGPSVVPDNFNGARLNVQWNNGDAMNGQRVSFFSYGSRWNATDGYPQRALDRGYITRFGTLDPSDGGRTQRHLVIGRRQFTGERTVTRLMGFVQYYDLDLFSNLTFWTRDPYLGDQIQQSERRLTSGASTNRDWLGAWRGRGFRFTSGLQVRNDLVGMRLANTDDRVPVDKHDDGGRLLPAIAISNRILETTGSAYVDTELHWTPAIRTIFGARVDGIHTTVLDRLHHTSRSATGAIVSPKAGVAVALTGLTELYANAGLAFHSNHANGVVQEIDASPLLVRTKGAEIGLRVASGSAVQSSISVWLIDSDSELVYAPEIGFTQPERPGRRTGVEWNNFYRVSQRLVVDADFAWSTARYRTDPFGEGSYVPDAISGVVAAGATLRDIGRFSGSVRGRYLGRRPLEPTGTILSRRSMVVNGEVEMRMSKRLTTAVEIFNVFDREYDDIAYYFPTRLRDPSGALEPAERPDFVTHPGEPHSARVRLRLRF